MVFFLLFQMQLECFDVHFYVPVAVVTCTCFLAIIGLFVFYTRGLTENCYPAYKTAKEVNEAQVARKRRQLSRRRTNKNFHVLGTCTQITTFNTTNKAIESHLKEREKIFGHMKYIHNVVLKTIYLWF